MRKLELISLIVGVVFFFVLLGRIGWGAIFQQLLDVGWTFLLVLLVSTGRYAARTQAWRYAFAADRELPSFGEMFQARLAAQAIGYLTFAGPLLSEPAKAGLLREQMPLRIGLGGALLEAGASTLTSTFILVAGWRWAWCDRNRRRAATRWLGAGCSLWSSGWAGAGFSRAGFVSSTIAAAGARRIARLVERRRSGENGEQQLLDFYARNTRRFRLMFLWEMISQVFALLEIYIILVAMGVTISWVEVVIIEAFSKGLTTIFFFVPGRVGTDEGGLVALFKLMRLGVAHGASLALVQRLRGIFWAAVGLALLARYAVRRSQ
jgi:uncharacterized membrane protein YbhN (UPF0104 family)